MRFRCYCLLAMLGVCLRAIPQAVNHPAAASIQTIEQDMTEPPDALPHGFQRSWATAAVHAGNNAPLGFQAITGWGVLCEEASGNPAANSRVEIRNIRLLILSTSAGAWRTVQSSASVHGAMYLESFAENQNIPAAVRAEPDGGTSVKAGEGRCYHFVPPGGMVPVDTRDIGAVLVGYEARLVTEDPVLPDDRANARYVADAGADYWLSNQVKWDQYKTNKEVGRSRFKQLTSNWQSFYFSTLNAEQLRHYPPPALAP